MPGDWPWLCAGYAVACLAMAAIVLRMPRVGVPSSRRIRLFDAFRHVRADRPFRKLLGCWMLLGIGNLVAMALFVEYVTNPRYGLGFDAARVGLLTTTLPMSAFVVCVVGWGVLFDRVNFYLLRVAINVLFVAGIACYYFGGSFAMLVDRHAYPRGGPGRWQRGVEPVGHQVRRRRAGGRIHERAHLPDRLPRRARPRAGLRGGRLARAPGDGRGRPDPDHRSPP